VTVRAVAERLEVSPATVYALVAANKLRCCRVGLGRGCIRISEEQLADFLRGAEPKPDPPASAPRVRLRHLRLS
jgi:excisionase family DNA binding protein